MAAGDIALVPIPLGEPEVDVSLLDSARLTDRESALVHFLTPKEREEYERLRHPSRRSEWLGARVCLKTMLADRGCVDDPQQCEIVKDPRGRPRLRFSPGYPLAAVVDCSLSHSTGLACACTSSAADTRVGVDIEKVSSRLERVVGAFVNEKDALIGSRSPEEHLTVLWALKEAFSKVVGVGLGVGFSEVICQETTIGRHTLRTAEGSEFRARHCVYGGYVIALCMTKGSSCASGA